MQTQGQRIAPRLSVQVLKHQQRAFGGLLIDDALEHWTVVAMEREGLIVNGKARRDSMARGEAGAIQQGGGRFVTVACEDSEVFHSTADRWPEAIDVALLARYAEAFANGGLELAQQSV